MAGVLGMRTVLLAALMAIVAPAPTTPAAPAVAGVVNPKLSFDDVVLFPGETREQRVTLFLDHYASGAHVVLDARAAKDFVDITVDPYYGCTVARGLVTCAFHDHVYDGATYIGLVPIRFTRRAGTPNRAFDAYISGSVGGEQAPRQRFVISSWPGGELVPVGAHVSAGGRNRVTLQVGIRNDGRDPAVRGLALVLPPGNAAIVKAPQACGPQGPSEYEYICHFNFINPGTTIWYELTVKVLRDKPSTPGYVKVWTTGAEVPIVITMDSLPVTGFPVGPVAGTGVILLLAGVALAVFAGRLRRRAQNVAL